MSKDDRFIFPDPTPIPSEKASVGRGKKMLEAQVKNYLNKHADKWIFVYEVEAALKASDEDISETARQLGYHVHHSVHADTLDKIVKFTKK